MTGSIGRPRFLCLLGMYETSSGHGPLSAVMCFVPMYLFADERIVAAQVICKGLFGRGYALGVPGYSSALVCAFKVPGTFPSIYSGGTRWVPSQVFTLGVPGYLP